MMTLGILTVVFVKVISFRILGRPPYAYMPDVVSARLELISSQQLLQCCVLDAE